MAMMKAFAESLSEAVGGQGEITQDIMSLGQHLLDTAARFGRTVEIADGAIHFPPSAPSTGVKSIVLPESFSETEQGHTLIHNYKGGMVAWIRLEEDLRLEVSFNLYGHPMLRVCIKRLPDEELAEHINNRLSGWSVEKCNVEGVTYDPNTMVVGKMS